MSIQRIGIGTDDALRETNSRERISVRNLLNADSATTLSAARGRLASIAEQCQRNKANLTNKLYYGQKSQLEETIDVLQCDHDLDAVVTRNHYGCLVLNTARALFIDVDMLQPSRTLQPSPLDRDSRSRSQQRMLDDLCAVLASEQNEGFRIYQTAAGFRILATTRQFAPGSRESLRLMSAVGADNAFVKLCETQQSFRARLTPKPWRCGVRRPPNSFPRASTKDQRQFAEWRAQYEQACRDRATCQFLGHIGPPTIDHSIEPIVEFHDRETRAFLPLQLA